MLKPLLALSFASFLLWTMPGRGLADDPVVDVPANAPVTTTPTPAVPADSADSSASDNQQPPQSDQGTLPPDSTQATTNPQVPNTPLLATPSANPYTPFSLNPTTLNAQSPQITTPSLYTTGINDISQISTNNALLQAFSTPSTSGFMSAEEEGNYSFPPIERVRIGPFDLKAALVTGVVYDDNINGTQGQGANVDRGSKEDMEYSATPAVLLVYGDHDGQRGYASLIYSPTITRYYHHTDENDINQNVAFNAQYPFQRLTLNFSASYGQSTGINQDSNTRTTQTATSISFGGNYIVDEKLTLNSQLQEVITSFSAPGGGQQQGNNIGEGGETTSLNNSLTYSYSDKLSFGPSLNFGIDSPENEGQSTYEQALVGVTYQPRPKFNFFFQGGVDLRQYDNSGGNNQNQASGNQVNPIFSAGVGYNPFDSTALSLSASQSVRSSDTNSGQTAIGTGVTASATQRFFQRAYLNFTFNYSHNDYQAGSGQNSSTVGATFNSSSYDEFSYRTSFSITPTGWSSVSLYYQYLDNESELQTDSYHDNQVGISVSAQF